MLPLTRRVTALSSVLYVLLLVVAVEAFWNKSPVRWWVAVPVGVYLLGSAALWSRRHPLWQRFDLGSKATVSFFLLLGLLAVTVWLPGGLTEGLRVLTLSTSTILSLVTAAAIAISGAVLFRVSYPHAAVRWTIAAFVAYGVMAFLWGVYTGTPFSALFRGESFWTWLPRWLQGAFVGGLIVVPSAMLVQIAARFQWIRLGGSRDWGLRRATTLALAFAMSAAAVASPTGSATTFGPISRRGPGTKPHSLEALKRPAPSAFDLVHVDPAHFAAALGSDPAKIFAFVRDSIAFEAYPGILRGPRGTLLAMAGNSADRALLLASLLERAGHRVRFVRGTLPEREAKAIVSSMWATRPQPARRQATGDPLPALQAALGTLADAVRRDYALIGDHLKQANVAIPRQSGPSLASLVSEAQVHYWLQWQRDGSWVDIDPSFGDAVVGQAHARRETTFDRLPEELFHRVTLRLRVEEYAVMLQGEADVKPTIREVLTYTAKAADLSGVDVVLAHEPENWKGPAANLQDALSSAIESTGRVKPILVVGDRVIVGDQPFQQKLPTNKGIGGVSSQLGGKGSRTPLPIATAAWLDLEFMSPDGRKVSIVRDIFDMVGKARRAAGRTLSAQEVRVRTEADTAFDIAESIFDLLFTTGRVDAAHLSSFANLRPADRKNPDVRALLLGINIAFTATSDLVLNRLGAPQTLAVRVYPDSPRVQIVELYSKAGAERLSLDLRRDYARVVAVGPDQKSVFFARVLRGVLNGTLERILLEYVTARSGAGAFPWHTVMSTSVIFERARGERVPLVLLRDENGLKNLEGNVPDEALVRLRESVAQGHVAITPTRAINIGGINRLAWWLVNPASGDTIAVTDDGLHAEHVMVVNEEKKGVAWVSRGGTLQVATYTTIEEFAWRIGILLQAHYEIVERLPPPWNDLLPW
jgi:hypothetical protein